MPNRPVQERSRRTYDALLEAAADLLADEGIERLSTNLVCERAGVTPPAFYRYFKNKYAILEALAERLGEQQNVVLLAWIERWRDTDLDAIAAAVPELLRETHEVTMTAPGALWIMRALHAIPRLTHIRLDSHNHAANLLADMYQPFLPNVPREIILRRARLSVEIAYSIDEMLKEGEADPEFVFDDIAHIFDAMFRYPDYGRD